MGQRGGVGIAKRAIDGIRSGSHFKPLQQGFGLRVIKESLIAATLPRDLQFPGSPGKLLKLGADLGTAKLVRRCFRRGR